MQSDAGNRTRANASTDAEAVSASPVVVAIGRQLPHLAPAQRTELARIVDLLVHEFNPEHIYVYGSQARGDAHVDSDVDLLVVMSSMGSAPYDLARRALELIGWGGLAVDVVFIDRARFEERAPVVMSLPGIVLREGKLLYAAANAAAA